MTHLRRSPRSCASLFAKGLAAGVLATTAGHVSAQAAASADSAAPVQLKGGVTDPSGAFIPAATLHFRPLTTATTPDSGSAAGTVVQSDAGGHYTASLKPGNYTVTVTAEGFNPLSRQVAIGARSATLNLKLTVAASDVVDVSASNTASTDNADNKSALVFKGDQLAALATDDSTLQQEITAMAGGSGEGGSQLYVNGFSGGRFPPKDTIREVRINSNPYSTQFENLGYGRVEIFTKPGGDTFHGDLFSLGTTKAFNSLNPYTGAQGQPDYFFLLNNGSFGGPINKKTSFFVSAFRDDQHNNAIVKAENQDGSPLLQSVPSPQTSYTLSGRLDRQLSKNNTFLGRYEYSNSAVSNSGVGLLVLQSQGLGVNTTTQTLQLGNTQTIGANIISETRFQFVRTHVLQTPNSTDVSTVVQGAFSSGGSSAQSLDDLQDQYEFQEYLSVSRGHHFLTLGGRYRLLHQVNSSNASYNGQYTFASLADFQAKKPSLFSISAGQQSARLLTGDLGAYAEDEWKIRKDLTASFGLRLESQSAIPDHLDPAPRADLSWAVRQTDKHGPLFVLRGGAGIFYTRFASANILTSIRQNGVSQLSYQFSNPDPTVFQYPTIPSLTQLAGTAPTPYRISPGMRIASENIASVEIDRTLGKIGQISATYYAVRGVHEYNSSNINAPLANGTRPLGGANDIYQFRSDGIEKAQSLTANAQLRFGKRVQLFTFYTARRQHSDTSGSTSFPSQPYNVSADYGPSGLGGQSVGQRLFAFSNVQLPASFYFHVFTAAYSRSRFNITTGTDNNSDTQSNDRPAFATQPGSTSLLYRTAYGTFDGNPQPGEAIIPYNYGLGPRLVFVGGEVGRDFKFGPRGAAPTPPPGSLKPGQAAPRGEPRYTWSIAVDAQNVLNTNNAGTPVGVLTSPYFGQSISTSSNFSQLTAANRVIFLDTSFRF